MDIETDSSGNWTTLLSNGGSITSWSRRDIDLSQYADSTIRIRFRLTSNYSGQYQGWYIDQINIYTPDYKTLTIQISGSGTTTPSEGSTLIERRIPTPIMATPSADYRFKNWTIISENATISDINAVNAAVTITEDATIQANFIAGTVYPITSNESTYNFTTHYYEIQPSNGVRFIFTAPEAGSVIY
jgi:hypothetical protein